MVDASDKVLMVIPSINGGALLRRMLPTLRFDPSRVVVLDQGSTDDTAEVCAEANVELVQLSHPHTYTQGCNIGAALARERGARYVCISNNDIVFRTDVIGAMLAEMERDDRLGIVAPSQIIVDETLGNQPLSYRVRWDLETVDFFHEVKPLDTEQQRLECDFCELTCALVRLSIVDEIGFLDDAYGFYHEDADFGYRLRQAGYSCAYLPAAQIEHFSSSTFNKDKLALKAEYIAKNKQYFAGKHLGYGLHLPKPSLRHADAWDAYCFRLHPFLKHYGLLNSARPDLMMSSPGAETQGIIYTAYEGTALPPSWSLSSERYQGVFTTSRQTCDLFEAAGYRNAFVVPLGVETDLFNPWGPSRRLFDEKTYLAILDRSQTQALDLILKAWQRFSADRPGVKLVLFGLGLLDSLGRAPDSQYRWGDADIACFAAEKVIVHEVSAWPDDEDMAVLYRSVDFTIGMSSNEGRLSTMLESHACGTPCIFADLGLSADFKFDGALGFGGGSDAGLSIGSRKHPSADDLLEALIRSDGLDDAERGELAMNGLFRVRNGYTLRNSAMMVRNALSQMQERDPEPTIEALRRRNASASAITVMNKDRATALTRLGGIAARRLKTAGRLTEQFGAAWEANGFKSATDNAASEVGYFVAASKRRWTGVRRDLSRLGRKGSQAATALYRRGRQPVTGSTLLIGYIDAQLGLGQSLRGLALALSRTSRPFSIYPFTVGVEDRRGAPYMAERYDTGQAHAVNVIEVTPDELPKVFGSISRTRFDRSYNILRTYWELSRAPESWRPKLAAIDEIWAPNAFVAESFRTVFDGPITVIPPCVIPPDIDGLPADEDARERFRLDAGRFYFFFSFDYYSFLQRKNPLAVVRAFQKAFPDQAAQVGLVVKSTGSADHHPDVKKQLVRMASFDDRIRIIDQSLSRGQMLSLMKATDCYVSLHRAEGFGLGMAEAMTLGKPVIGTDYSGNTEFVRPDTAYPIAYRLKRLSPHDYIYTEGQVWAEPDEVDCAAAMVRVVSEPDDARRRADAGKAFIHERFGVENVARLVDARLGEILSGPGPVSRT